MSSELCHNGANPLAAAYYADRAQHFTTEVVLNERVARDTYRLRLACPELARIVLPGQFFMVRLPGCDDPLLGRPLALYDTVLDASNEPSGIDVVYLVIGKMTAKLAKYREGDTVELWGPLGNGFSAEPVEHLIMVAGGIGQTPFLALGRQFLGRRKYGQPQQTVPPSQKLTLCYGVRSAELLAGVEDFRSCGVEVKISSDDGSVGHPGLVTEILEQELVSATSERCRVVCCGPEPMMEAVAGVARSRQIPCEASLETPMACGIGICFSCVVKLKQPDGGWDYKRTCVDGPVFDAEKIVW